MFSLTGRAVLLTGAAGYLGRAMSRAIIDAGADLTICGRRIEALEATRDHCCELGRKRCHIVPADVTNEEDVARLRRIVEQRFGRLHGLVNNAYEGRVGTIDAVGPEEFQAACRINLVAPFILIKELRHLLEAGGRDAGSSSVVNVASMYGTVSPDPDIYGDSGKNNPAHYGATKAGLIQLTRYLACHLGASGIRVNSIAPGPFPDLTGKPVVPGFYEELAAKVPMKRVGEPHEVAGPVVFLLSDAASYINGANLPIDGGWTAW